MMYFDTSFLVPLILPERTSDSITAYLRGLDSDRFATSHWTKVEFSSLIARKVRADGMDIKRAAQADAQFEAMVEGSFLVLLPQALDFNLAKQYLSKYDAGLRAGDALHLAIANNNRAGTIYSLDKTFLRAGNILGLPVSMGIQESR